MTKERLARLAVELSWRSRKERFDIEFFPMGIFEKIELCDELELFLTISSGCAATKLIKGRVCTKGSYLVSRGKELNCCKPDAVAEYSRHWPYDYCYFYKI